MRGSVAFGEFFRAATGHEPFDCQRRLATEVCADGPKSLAINVPTGAGKTAAAVLAARTSGQRWPGSVMRNAVSLERGHD